MAFKCYGCGHIFELGEEKCWIESYGEEQSGCPLCEDSYGETKKCSICGGEFLDEELRGYENNVCEECANKCKYDIDMCYRIGSTNSDEVEINSFLTSMFSVDEIEVILYRELKEAQKLCPIDCSPFIEIDRDWFVDELAKEVKKSENTKS